MRFRDRRHAGREVAALVKPLGFANPVVLALPRGGVPVAFEVARSLGAPLEVIVARKIGAPHQPELGIGAVAEGGARVLDRDLVRHLGLTDDTVERLAQDADQELRRRVHEYRADRPLPRLAGADVLVVDDGVATGATAEAALRAVRGHEPARLVLAVPTCSPSALVRLEQVADEVVSVIVPHELHTVGQWYDDFTQTTDEDVLSLLSGSA